MVKAGFFKKISASFYRPDSPKNPKPGVYYLRHVGFLGAAPPAVKGLKSASFADNEEGVVEFGDWTDVQSARILRRLRDWLIGKFGSEEADKAVPGYEVDSLQEQTSAAAAKSNQFSETTREEQQMADDLKKKEQEIAREQKLTAGEAATAAKEASFAEREGKITAAEAKTRRADLDNYVEGLIKEGRIIPAHKTGLVEFMAGLSSAGAVVEFGEGRKKEKKPRARLAQDLPGRAAEGDLVQRARRRRDRRPLDNADAIAKSGAHWSTTRRRPGGHGFLTPARPSRTSPRRRSNRNNLQEPQKHDPDPHQELHRRGGCHQAADWPSPAPPTARCPVRRRRLVDAVFGVSTEIDAAINERCDVHIAGMVEVEAGGTNARGDPITAGRERQGREGRRPPPA